MAEVLNAFPEIIKEQPDPTSWDLWLDGRIWKLIRGADFSIPSGAFRKLAILESKKRGLLVHVEILPDGSNLASGKIDSDVIVLQAK